MQMDERLVEFLNAKGTTLEKEKEKELNDFMKRLEERKQEYNASGRGIDFNKERTVEEEDERMQNLAERQQEYTHIPIRSLLDFAQYTSHFGVDIGEEIACQKELHLIVDDMKVKLVDEKKILEGTLNPEYGKGDWTMPHIERTIHENELSKSKPIEQQWKRDSQNGCLTTDPTPISTSDSSSSSDFAELFNQSCPIAPLRIRSTQSPTNSCSENLDASGTETDVMNESSECTVPMTNEQMDGMPNEVKW